MMLPSEADDEAAIAQALERYRELYPDRADDLDEQIAKDPRWAALSVVADLQCRYLRLKPWEWVPSWVGNPFDPGDDVQEQAAAALLRRMFRHGVSRFHFDPLSAIEAAKRKRRRLRAERAAAPEPMHDA
jgi:hypothetical protein